MSARVHHASLGAVLTVITGKMVTDLDDFYPLQDFLADRPLMTHERAMAFEVQRDALLAQFPRLAEVEAPEFTADSTGSKQASVRAWADAVAAHVGWTEADVRFVEGCGVNAAEAFAQMFGARS